MTKILGTVLCLNLLSFNLALAQVADSKDQPSAKTNLTDGQIAQVMMTINSGEIDSAKMAVTRSKNEETKKFAQMMLAEHEKNRSQTRELAALNKTPPTTSPLSKSLTKDAKSSNDSLKKESKDFDMAYVDQQIKMHGNALRTFDEKLLPNAVSSPLRNHLEKTRDAVAAHLDHAKTLKTKLE